MASVLVKNMEMPAKCFDCIFCDYECAYCLADVKERSALEFLETRPDWCPLIPVPDHGRLIDADKLDTRDRGNNSQRIMWSNIREIIADADTIIPSEKEASK